MSRQLIDDRLEPLALDELHGVEDDVAVLAHLEDWHDIGVVQPRRGPRLAAEPLQRLAVLRHDAGQDLQRDPTAERDLLGLVHHAHPAAAHLADHPVIAHLTHRWSGSRGRRIVSRFQDFLGLLHLDQRREQLANLVGHRRAAVDVFLERRPLAPAVAPGELLGHLIKQRVIGRSARC